jgi:tetratricopeptide (TPR) repeat protein
LRGKRLNTGPDETLEICRLAQAHHQAGRLDRAITGFRDALARDPAILPARFGLVSALLALGDVTAASAAMAGIAPRDADRPEILWLDARIAQAQARWADMAALLTRLLADGRLGDAQRAEASLALGLAQDALGQPKEAFAAAAQGKTIQRALHAGDASTREDEVAKLARLTAWIAATPPQAPVRRQPAIAGAAASHVFLLGFPRSGTTLLEQVLAAHPRVTALEEAPTLAVAYQAFLSNADACANLGRIEDDEAHAWAAHYWQTVHEHGVDPAGRCFIDKQPAGTINLPIIARLFPEARILFALRDPRDVVLSCFRQPFQMNAMTYTFTDLDEAVRCYDACMTLAVEARARLPLAWMDVRHERLVDDFDGELGRILDFLGLDFDPAVKDFARSAAARPIRTPSATQVRAGLNRRGLGRWEQYRDALAPVLPILAPWVERFGYPP